MTDPTSTRSGELDVWVVSYGGSYTNTVSHDLERMGFRVRTAAWLAGLCHAGPHLAPAVPPGVPVLYVFRDYYRAAYSQLRRGRSIWDVNWRKMTAGLPETEPVGEAPTSEQFVAAMVAFDQAWRSHSLQDRDVLAVYTPALYAGAVKDDERELLAGVLGPRFSLDALSPRKPTRLFSLRVLDALDHAAVAWHSRGWVPTVERLPPQAPDGGLAGGRRPR